MVSNELSEAAVEVLEILKYTKKSDVDKIPKSFIGFLKENCSNTFKITNDYSKPLIELKLRPKTEALLGLIYLKYWSNGEEQKKFERKLIENENRKFKDCV